MVPTTKPKPDCLPDNTQSQASKIPLLMPPKDVTTQVRHLINNDLRHPQYKLLHPDNLNNSDPVVLIPKNRPHGPILPNLWHLIQFHQSHLQESFPIPLTHGHLSLCVIETEWLTKADEWQTLNLAKKIVFDLGEKIHLWWKILWRVCCFYWNCVICRGCMPWVVIVNMRRWGRLWVGRMGCMKFKNIVPIMGCPSSKIKRKKQSCSWMPCFGKMINRLILNLSWRSMMERQ